VIFKPLINNKFQEGLSSVRKELYSKIILNSASPNSALPGMTNYLYLRKTIRWNQSSFF